MAGLGHRFIAEDDLIFLPAARLAVDLREESADAVVVLLHPFLKWMIVALGAQEPDAEENLHGAFAGIFRRGEDAPVIGGGVLRTASLGGHQLADEPVERLVAGDVVAEPAIHAPGALVAEQVETELEKVAPFQGP